MQTRWSPACWRARTNVHALRNAHLSHYLVFLPTVILYNIDFKISTSGNSFFIHKSLDKLVSTYFSHCQSKCTAFYQLFVDIVWSTTYSAWKKQAALIRHRISLYFNSPTGRSLFLDSFPAQILETFLSENILHYSRPVCCFSRHPASCHFDWNICGNKSRKLKRTEFKVVSTTPSLACFLHVHQQVLPG